MKKAQNFTPRTLELLRSKGYLCETVEKWKRFPDRKRRRCHACGNIPLIGVKTDLFNFADILAIKNGVVLVQVTSASNHAGRRNKILSSAEAKLCIMNDVLILIQSWRKVQNRWQAVDEWLEYDQFDVNLPNSISELYELRQKEKQQKEDDFPPGKPYKREPIKDSELPF